MPVAVITGGSRGIGRAVTQRPAGTGTSVVVNYRTERAAAGEVVAAIEKACGRAISVAADVTEPAQLRGLFDAASKGTASPVSITLNPNLGPGRQPVPPARTGSTSRADQ